MARSDHRDPPNKQLDNPGLPGWKQLRPQCVALIQRADGIRLRGRAGFLFQGGKHLRDHLGRLQDATDLSHDDLLDHSGGETHRGGFFAGFAIPDHVHRHIVAIELSPFFVLAGVIAAPVALKISPLRSEGVCARLLLARLRGLLSGTGWHLH